MDETDSNNRATGTGTQESHAFEGKSSRKDPSPIVQPRKTEKAQLSQTMNTQQKDLFHMPANKSVPRDWQSWKKIALWAKSTSSINTFWGDFAERIALALRQKRSISANDDQSMKKLWDMYRRKGTG